MRFFGCLIVLLAVLFGVPSQIAYAQSLKNVSPTKYEKRAPASSYSFERTRTLKQWGRDDYPDNIEIVTYRSEDGRNDLYGILDQRERRPKWILQPHYEVIGEFGPDTLIAKRTSGADQNYCVLSLNDARCTETDFSRLTRLSYRTYQPLPNWVGDMALYAKTERKNVVDVQLFTPDGHPLTIVRDVMNGLMPDIPGHREYTPKAFQVGDKLSIRTKTDEGGIRDALLRREDDGRVSRSFETPHSIIEYEDFYHVRVDGKFDLSQGLISVNEFAPLSTIDTGLGLVWPIYPDDTGRKARPDSLIGLKPLAAEYDAGEFFSKHYGDSESALHLCCAPLMGWAVLWATDEGAAYAFLQNEGVPDYASIAATRDSAVYADIERLWKPGADTSMNTRIARANGELIGQYAFEKLDGKVEILGWDKLDRTAKLIASMPAANLPSWRQDAMRQVASRQADAEASYRARQEQRQADRLAREQALAEQSRRLKRERQAAREARQAEIDAAAAARDAAAATRPQQRMEKVLGSWATARTGYCNSNTWQTDLYAKAHAKKACKDRGGNPGPTWVTDNGYDPFAPSADQCYSARAVTECYFNK